MSEPIPNLPYGEARRQAGDRVHAARSVAQADIHELEWDSRPALLKDFSRRPWLVRRLWSRRIVGREVRALRRLDGAPGFPRLYATAGPNAFIMERLDAVRLPRRRHWCPSPEFWSRARELIERLHAAGVSHGDLRRKNILISRDQQPYLIDFATSAREREGRLDAWVSTFIHHRMARIDRATFVRIKASYDPDGLDEIDRRWLADAPWYLESGRWLKRNVYRLRKPHVLRRRLKELRRRFLRAIGRKSRRPSKSDRK